MTTNIRNSSLSGKLKKVTFSQNSKNLISKILEKEFTKTNCSFKSFELVQIADHHNLGVARLIRAKHNLKY